jgi:hypothetical protein
MHIFLLYHKENNTEGKKNTLYRSYITVGKQTNTEMNSKIASFIINKHFISTQHSEIWSNIKNNTGQKKIIVDGKVFVYIKSEVFSTMLKLLKNKHMKS